MKFGMKKRKSEDGQAMVEFALTFPLVVLILSMIIDFGWIFTHELVLSTAVREGARLGSTCASSSDMVSRVTDKVEAAADICDPDKLHIDVHNTNISNPSEGDVVVTVDYDLNLLTPFASPIFGGMVFPIHSSCTMKAE